MTTVEITEPAPTTSRAGRNLPAAIVVGLSLGGVILGTVYSPYKWTFVAIVVAAGAVGTTEIVKALRTLGAQPPMAPLNPGCASATWLIHFGSSRSVHFFGASSALTRLVL